MAWYDYVVKVYSTITHPKRIIRYGKDNVLAKNKNNKKAKRSHRDQYYDNQRDIEEGRFDEIDQLFRFDHMSKIQKW